MWAQTYKSGKPFYREHKASRGHGLCPGGGSITTTVIDEQISKLIGAIELGPQWLEEVLSIISLKDEVEQVKKKRQAVLEKLRRMAKAYIDGVLDKVETLWEDMNNDGVDNIFHLGYYNLKKGTLTILLYGGTKLNPAVNYADNQLASACAVSPAECWSVDPRADFLGKESTYIKSDGIHPANPGAKVIAAKIWNKMVSVGAYK